ncbi:hypothetical protein NNL21_32670 [Paenibacillus mendelii]|uniref:hypothetical protein n=1 Tax=Paenibacillus mendelii TaxID=206163 RepID=UPI001D6BC6AA|nr:hypothetical protein [Paenibacillus mendelii]
MSQYGTSNFFFVTKIYNSMITFEFVRGGAETTLVGGDPGTVAERMPLSVCHSERKPAIRLPSSEESV